MKTLYKLAAHVNGVIVATSALFVLTAPSLAGEADTHTPFVGVHSLRADNGDFDSWGADPGTGAVKSRHSFGLVDPIQTGSDGGIGAVSTSKCLGVSPRAYDPVSPNCRN
ncbi:hypothetical protein OOJ09_30905 [Mesorhizobium qingshengii]|uniref:Porin n=1 Tax=Mesorhizobium qingshengii TaxID=1165689 RepID=A0ABT4R4W9_9HYPH|nr:hypothetical protein [Mesorhizobium qingshengii]MCZ8548593.1 hypothetical protein [Mesorhizobium qingshengii]